MKNQRCCSPVGSKPTLWLGSKPRFGGRTFFWSKTCLAQKKPLGSKQVCLKGLYGLDNPFGSQTSNTLARLETPFWPQHLFGSKIFWLKNPLGSKQVCLNSSGLDNPFGSPTTNPSARLETQFWRQNRFGSKTCSAQKPFGLETGLSEKPLRARKPFWLPNRQPFGSAVNLVLAAEPLWVENLFGSKTLWARNRFV